MIKDYQDLQVLSPNRHLEFGLGIIEKAALERDTRLFGLLHAS